MYYSLKKINIYLKKVIKKYCTNKKVLPLYHQESESTKQKIISIMKISISNLSASAQIELNSISSSIRKSAQGSLACILSGGLETHGADIKDIEDYLLASFRAKKAEQEWDQCPIDSDEWDEKADYAKHCAGIAGKLIKKIL
jgi:hypothetical protein